MALCMTGELFLYQLVILILMVLSVFFASSETALMSSSRIKLEAMAESGSWGARSALYFFEDIDSTLGMLLIGNNLVNISATSFITYIFSVYYSADENMLILITALQTIVFLVFCETVPKVVARANPEKLIILYSYPLRFFQLLFQPLVFVSIRFSNLLKKRFRIDMSDNSMLRSRDEIDMMFRIGGREGIIDKENLAYVSEILSFRNIISGDVMTPSIDIVSIEVNSDISELVELFYSSSFSRIPVYEKRVDNIIGYIFFRDIIFEKKLKSRQISDFIVPPFYIPSTKNIFELYVEMNQNKTPVAFVVNEFGAVCGMITKEDIAEEVVGEIHTLDHHEDEELIVKLNDKKFIADGNIDVEHLNRLLRLNIEKKGFQTLAGFISCQTGKIPQKGEVLRYNRVSYLIEEATDRLVEKVVITLPGKIKKSS